MIERSDGLRNVEHAAMETRFDPNALDIPEGCPPEVRARILKKREELKRKNAERIRQCKPTK